MGKFILRFIKFKDYLLSVKNFYFYKRLMRQDHPANNFPVKIVPWQNISPFEFFDYYAAFYYWVLNFLKSQKNLNILTVGGVNLANAILSIEHKVTAIVLVDPKDKLTNVKYVVHDVFYPLPFPDKSFDVFISPATLHLVGLGRYGDICNPYTLLNFLKELKQVLRNNSYVFVSLPLGKKLLVFNHHYIFDFDTIIKLFEGFELDDFLVDEWGGFPGYTSGTDIKALAQAKITENFKPSKESRFSKNIDISSLKKGEYKIIFLRFIFKGK